LGFGSLASFFLEVLEPGIENLFDAAHFSAQSFFRVIYTLVYSIESSIRRCELRVDVGAEVGEPPVVNEDANSYREAWQPNREHSSDDVLIHLPPIVRGSVDHCCIRELVVFT